MLSQGLLGIDTVIRREGKYFRIRNLASAALLAACVGFAVPASAVTPVAMAGHGLSNFYLLGLELGPWEDYLLRELTPDLEIVESMPEPRISWFDRDQAVILPDFARVLLASKPSTMLTFGYHRQFDAELLAGSLSQADPFQSVMPGNMLQREFVTSGVLHQLDNDSILGVSAVFAYQRFSTPGLGFVSTQDNLPLTNQGSVFDPNRESSYGAGVRLAMRSELKPGLSFDAGFQSRIDMDAFNNYRGIYSESSELDIPAKAHLGIELKATDNASITMAVDHVLYSDINAFPSQFLPESFIAKLGDSTSPEFAWENLTIYSVGWRWKNKADTQWWLDLTTRQQPNPTAPSLNRALQGQLADNAMLMGFRKRTSDNAHFNITAAYASPEYIFGGSVLGVTSEDLDQQLEVEALWVVKF